MNGKQIQKIIENGGATLNREGVAVSFSAGYQVSKKDCYIIAAENVGGVLRAVLRLLRRISAGEYVGVWVDGGRVYIDISERIAERSEALELGRGRGQISVFDWNAGACVYC